MNLNFVATCAHGDTHDGVHVVGVADSSTDPQHYLLLSFCDGDVDRREVHVEVDDQSRAATDAIRSYELSKTELIVWFRDSCAKPLRCDGVTCELRLSDGDRATLRTGLELALPGLRTGEP